MRAPTESNLFQRKQVCERSAKFIWLWHQHLYPNTKDCYLHPIRNGSVSQGGNYHSCLAISSQVYHPVLTHMYFKT